MPELLSASGRTCRTARGAPPATPVVIENDANCAVVAEHAFGAARGFDDVVMATLGRASAGILLGGSLVGGATLRREIGHMVVDRRAAVPCGSRGCWSATPPGRLGRLALEAALAGHLVEVVELAGGPRGGARRARDARRLEGTGRARRPRGARLVVALGLSNLARWSTPSCSSSVVAWPRRATSLCFRRGVRTPPWSRRRPRPPVGIVVAELGERAGRSALRCGTSALT